MARRKQTRRGKYNRQKEALDSPQVRDSETLQDQPQIAQTDAELQLEGLQQRLRCLLNENNETGQRNLISRMIHLLYSFEPRPQQVDCIQWLLYKRRDLILVAKTSFGKSVIMQALPCLVPKIVIIILPLLALGAEQVQKIRQLPSANPIFINSDNINNTVLWEIQHGKYTHILSSPELLIGKRFRRILHDPEFRGRVGWVVVDEIHLVSVWGIEFRRSYAMLQTIRHALGDRPWFGCTATLDDETFGKVCDFAAFKSDTKIIRTSIDRPEILLIRGVVKRTVKSSFQPLHFVVVDASTRRDGTRLTSSRGLQQLKESSFNCEVSAMVESCTDTLPNNRMPGRFSVEWTNTLTPGNFNQLNESVRSFQNKQKEATEKIVSLPLANELIPCPESIPKTLIFADTLKQCCNMTDMMRKWLRRLGYSEVLAERTVQPFYSTMIASDKDRILSEFAKTDTSRRIFISSEALAHGKDIPDVDIVVVYGIPRNKDPSVILQKFGRAARAPDRNGIAILIGDSWCIGKRSNAQLSGERNSRLGQGVRFNEVDFEDGPGATDAASLEDALSAILLSDEPDLPSDLPIQSSPPRLQYAENLIPKSKHRGKTDVERRAELPPVVWKFMNEESECLRRTLLKWFREDLPSDHQNRWCCSNCNPSLDITGIELDINDKCYDKLPEDYVAEFEKKLRKWLQTWLDTNLHEHDFPLQPEYILSGEKITEIARSSFPMQSIKEFLQSSPGSRFLKSDIDELATFIQDTKHQIATRDAGFQNSSQNTPGPVRLKRKRLGEIDGGARSKRNRTKRK